MKKRKIGIFSGSFNPIHYGHLQSAKFSQEQMGLDEIWFSLVRCSAFKFKKYREAKFDFNISHHKLKMLEIALTECNNPTFKIDKWEYMQNVEINYSIDYVKHLTQNNLDCDFYFIIGDDLLDKLHDWKEITELSKLCKIVVLKRIKKPLSAIATENCQKYCVKLLNNELFPGKSTDIIQGNNIQISNYLSKGVLEYINKFGLYFNERLKYHLSDYRRSHSFNVMKCAVALAYKNNVNLREAFTAAIYHDICKEWSIEDLKLEAKKHHFQTKNLASSTLHAPVGAFYIHDAYAINNKNILKAIKNHTIPVTNMSKLEKILFVADSLSEDREFPEKEMLLTAVFKNLDEGFVLVLQNYKNYLKAAKITISQELKTVFQSYISNKRN